MLNISVTGVLLLWNSAKYNNRISRKCAFCSL